MKLYLLHQTLYCVFQTVNLAPLNILHSFKQIENGCKIPYLNSGYRLDMILLMLPITWAQLCKRIVSGRTSQSLALFSQMARTALPYTHIRSSFITSLDLESNIILMLPGKANRWEEKRKYDDNTSHTSKYLVTPDQVWVYVSQHA